MKQASCEPLLKASEHTSGVASRPRSIVRYCCAIIMDCAVSAPSRITALATACLSYNAPASSRTSADFPPKLEHRSNIVPALMNFQKYPEQGGRVSEPEPEGPGECPGPTAPPPIRRSVHAPGCSPCSPRAVRSKQETFIKGRGRARGGVNARFAIRDGTAIHGPVPLLRP